MKMYRRDFIKDSIRCYRLLGFGNWPFGVSKISIHPYPEILVFDAMGEIRDVYPRKIGQGNLG